MLQPDRVAQDNLDGNIRQESCRMCRLSQGCSGGVSVAAGQVQGSQRGAAVFVKEVAISLVCASANPLCQRGKGASVDMGG